MPKQQRIIEVYQSWGDQHGDSTSHLWFDTCGDSKWASGYGVEAQRCGEQGYTIGVRASDMASIHIKLVTYLHNNDIENVKKLLTRQFIYPGMISRNYPQNNHSHGEWNESGYETYYTRPVIEALFFDKPAVFHSIVEAILGINDPAIYQAFEQCLAGTDLSAAVLFEWDFTTQQNVLKEIADIKQYGEQLKADKSDALAVVKGEHAISLADKLDKQLNGMHMGKCNHLDAMNRFENLKLKMDMLLDLHSKDASFAVHRGYKHCITNLLSISFSAGIANAINRVVTGNWLFFDKTATEEKVSGIHQALGFSPEVRVELK
jgi:hypothetical protein